MRWILLAGLLAMQVSTDAPLRSSAPPTTVPECEPSDRDVPDVKKCSNLMPIIWRPDAPQTMTEKDISAIADSVESMPRYALARRNRRSAKWRCRRNWFNPDSRAFDVQYEIPAAVLNFPMAGTGTRELVTAIFTPGDPDNCWERRYGVFDSTGAWKRKIQFITVTTAQGSVASGGPDIEIGKWRSWSINQRENPDGTKGFELQELEHGAYRRCGHMHDTTKVGDISFVSCDDAAKIYDAARRGIKLNATDTRSATIAELFAIYNKGKWRDIPGVRLAGSPFDAPAWARCGNMGCCEAYK